jgi:hypothetical protein
MTQRHRAQAAVGLAALVLLAACGSSSTGDDDVTTTAGPSSTVTTSEPPPPTTAPPPSITGAAPTTTASVRDEAEGSGCTPGPGDLPDGTWYGFLVSTGTGTAEFDLACWFTGDAAARAAAEDGEESPPPNDYYVRNENETLREVAIAPDAEAEWFPDFGDPTTEETVPYVDWIDLIEARDFTPGVWLEIAGGEVVEVREQWVP